MTEVKPEIEQLSILKRVIERIRCIEGCENRRLVQCSPCDSQLAVVRKELEALLSALITEGPQRQERAFTDVTARAICGLSRRDYEGS